MDTPHTKKSLGQHWLNDPPTLDAIVEAANLADSDTVLEVGPGPGTLTERLTKQVAQVVAVEFDRRLAEDLTSRVKATNLQVINQDILSFNLSTLPHGYKVVANIPYYLTSALLRLLAESPNPPSTMVLLVQKEVAERVAARPGQMSLLSVAVQLYYQARLDLLVPAHLFTPPPKVDSQVLVLNRRTEPLFPDLDSKAFFRFVKAGFAARRKTLQNSLAGGLRQDKATTEAIITTAGLRPSVRPQELSLEDWHKLHQVIQGQLPHYPHKA